MRRNKKLGKVAVWLIAAKRCSDTRTLRFSLVCRPSERFERGWGPEGAWRKERGHGPQWPHGCPRSKGISWPGWLAGSTGSARISRKAGEWTLIIMSLKGDSCHDMEKSHLWPPPLPCKCQGWIEIMTFFSTCSWFEIRFYFFQGKSPSDEHLVKLCTDVLRCKYPLLTSPRG